MLVAHRVKVIDRFEVAREKLFLRFLHFFFLSFYDLLHLHFLRDFAIEPIDTGHVRAIIEAERRIIAQELRDRGRTFMVEEERWLIGRTWIGDDL